MKIRSIFLALLCALCLPLLVQAQSGRTYTIKGSLTDSAQAEPVIYATVSIKLDKQSVRSALSREDGSFVMEKIAAGTYELSVAAVGYQNVSRELVIDSTSKSTIDLGKILVGSQNTQLNAVEVTVDRPLVKQEIDRITYDVQADPESKIQTALDMLRKVPLVTVDGDDNIQVKGSTNFKVLINGRPSALVARSPKDVFKSMPASSIVKIEVITTPPAKYDSEGLAGIINVITTQKMESGYNGSIGMRYHNPWGPGMNASLTLKHKKLALSAYYGNGFQNMPSTGFSRNRTGLNPQTRLAQYGSSKNEWNWQYMQAELSYEIDTLNLVTAEFGYNPGGGSMVGTQSSALYNASEVIDQSYDQYTNNKTSWSGLDLGLNFQHSFKRNKEQILTLSYKNANNYDDGLNSMSLNNVYNYNAKDFRQYNKSGSHEQTYQVDYIHPVKKVDIEGGMKAIMRNNFSEYHLDNLDPLNGEYVTDPAQTNEFNYQQDVYSVYNSYNIKLKTWGFKAGARIEKTIVDADFLTTSTTVNQDYANIVPSVSIQKKFKDVHSITAGYTQRIARPSIWELNPYIDRSTPNFESSGNPNLDAVINHSFEMNYSTFKKGSITLGSSYSFANNTIENVTRLEADTVSRTTYENIGHDQRVGFNMSVNYPFNSKLSVTMNSSLSYVWLKGSYNGLEYQNDGFQGNAYAFASYTLPKDVKARINAGYYSPWLMLQGQSNPYVYTSFSLSKEFFDKKLSVTANISNPWNRYRYYKQDLSTSDFVQHMRYQQLYRSYGMRVAYQFGKLTDSIKKNQRGINNDDVKGKSSGGGQ
jgi:outer membrane receptor protein involved in Fe transport